jgi:hypothetical protein
MEYSKEDLVTEYNNLKKHLGKIPSSRIFYSESGISRRKLEAVFGSSAFTKLVAEAGDNPNVFSTEKITLPEILNQWGHLTRKENKLPTIADWQFNKCKPDIGNIKRTHGLKWADIPYAFFEHYASNMDWNDVLELIPNKQTIESTKNEETTIPSLDYKIHKFIPPVISNLNELSNDEEKFREFEQQVNLAFQLLGFEVTDYGQGTGRNPDGIAKEHKHRFAIIIDSKSRSNGYKIGTDDRTFIEYIKTYKEPLFKAGFQNIYLLIVSSRFESNPDKAINNIMIETNVSTSLISAKSLLKIVAKRIENPRLFDLKKFQKLLIEKGEITEMKIDKYLKSIK